MVGFARAVILDRYSVRWDGRDSWLVRIRYHLPIPICMYVCIDAYLSEYCNRIRAVGVF